MKATLALSTIIAMAVCAPYLGKEFIAPQPIVVIQQDKTVNPLEKARRATFLISLPGGGSGSATLVGRKKLDNGKYRYTALTAYHLVKTMAEETKTATGHNIEVMFQPSFHGKSLRVKLTVGDIEWAIPAQDWAAINFDMEHKIGCVQVATKEEFESIKPFEKIYAVGCGGGYTQMCREGIIGATHNEHVNIRNQLESDWLWDIHPEKFFRPYVNIWYGDSGGAVYNKEGKLIGIIDGFTMGLYGIPATHSTIAFKTHIMLDVLQHSEDFFLVED